MTQQDTVQLSEQELTARLRKETFNHPITLTSGVVGCLAATAAGLFTTSDFFLVLVGFSGVALIGCIGFVLVRNVISKHKSMLNIIEQVRLETESQRKQVGESVRLGLKEFKETKALHQLTQLNEKFEAFNTVLNLQFDNDEMAHRRYLTTAEQLYFGAVDNLRGYMMLRHSINAIDLEHIHRQLNQKQLEASSRQALSDRLNIHARAEQEMSDILAGNEQVMTKIDDVTSSLGSIQTREGLGAVRLETAMQEIQVLISRAKKYDISNG